MSAILSQLLAQRAQLEAEAAPLREQQKRCDAVIEAADKAQQHRDALLAEQDRTIAACIAAGRGLPPIDPELDQAEIALRRAQSSARGALLAQAQVVEQLAAINAQLSTVAAELEETIWQSVPTAAAHLFSAAETARIEFEKRLASLDGIARHAFEQAHQRGNGGPPEATPAMRCHVRMAGMIIKLSAALGANARRDFVTGPELLAAISDGVAEFGDVSRWEPASQALPDGSIHFNRGEALGAPVERGLPNPALSTSDVAEPAHAAAPTISGAELPQRLEPSSPTFMPSPRSG